MSINIFLNSNGRPINNIPLNDPNWLSEVKDYILWQQIRIGSLVYNFYGACELNKNDVLMKTYFAMCKLDNVYSTSVTINEHAIMMNTCCQCFKREFENDWL